jgi:hypothetical protein
MESKNQKELQKMLASNSSIHLLQTDPSGIHNLPTIVNLKKEDVAMHRDA